MIAISNLKLAPGADEAQLRALAAGALKKLGIPVYTEENVPEGL